jgi:hypothetical protein
MEGQIALVAWHTHTGIHPVKAATCLPANTVGHWRQEWLERQALP